MSLVLISWMKFVVQDSHVLNLNVTNDNLMKKFLKCWLLMAIITSFGMMIIILRNHIIILKIDIRLWRYWLISSLLFVFFSPLRLTPNPVIWSHLSFFFSLSSFQTLVKTHFAFSGILDFLSLCLKVLTQFFFPTELLYAVSLLADLIRQYPWITQKT